MRRLPGRSIRGDGRLAEKVVAALPFTLTPSQRMALAEIAADMAGETRMLRLLQGDVGSGKTVVALLAMLIAVESGAQAALLRSEEHTSELQSLMRISYAVFCLKKKTHQ